MGPYGKIIIEIEAPEIQINENELYLSDKFSDLSIDLELCADKFMKREGVPFKIQVREE